MTVTTEQVYKVFSQLCKDINMSEAEAIKRLSWVYLASGNSLYDLLDQVWNCSQAGKPFPFPSPDELYDMHAEHANDSGDVTDSDIREQLAAGLDLFDNHIGGYSSSSVLID